MHIINSPIDDIRDPEIEFFVSNAFIIKSQSVEIFWNIAHAVSAEITPDVGPVKLKGSIKLVPDRSTVYTLTAKGVLNNTTKSVSVSVYPTPVIERLQIPNAPEIRLEANFQMTKMEVPDIYKTSSLKQFSLRFPKMERIKKDFIPTKPDLELAIAVFDVTPQQLKDNNIEMLSPYQRRLTQFKSQTFNTLLRVFKSNPKLIDIIQTIRKHYE